MATSRGGKAIPSGELSGTRFGGTRVANPDKAGFKDPGDRASHGIGGGGVLSFKRDLARRAAMLRARKGGS